MARTKSAKSAKKYFWKDLYIGTIPDVIVLLKQAHALAGATNLQLLDQQSMSQETFINAMIVWVADLAATGGAKAIERTFKDAFEKLSELTAEDMKRQEAARLRSERAAAKERPDGFSAPEKTPGKKSSRPKPQDTE